jgi:hypothetical protein
MLDEPVVPTSLGFGLDNTPHTFVVPTSRKGGEKWGTPSLTFTPLNALSLLS